MRPGVAIVYNEPECGRYRAMGEEAAVVAVVEEVRAVHHALAESGYPVTEVPLVPPLERARERLERLDADLVFNLFEGFDGRPETEAVVADLIREVGLPCTGCPGGAISLALDKGKAKALLREAGIDTPGYQVLAPQDLSSFRLSFPCIVKPRAEDASHGLSQDSVVGDRASLERQVRRVSERFGGSALVEEFVDGREFNITLWGAGKAAALPISEIVYTLPPGLPRILVFSAKWEPGSPYYRGSTTVCPADISTELQARIVRTAESAFRLLGCSGYARVDFRLDGQGRPQVLEVNPNPDISPDSGAARQAQAAGMTYAQFIEKIALLAWEASRDRATSHPGQ